MGKHKHWGATCKCASSLFLSLGMIQQWLTQFNGISQWSTRANPLNDLYRQPPGRQAVESHLTTPNYTKYKWGQLRGISVSFLSINCITWIQSQFLKQYPLLIFFGCLQGIWKWLCHLSQFLAKQPENAQKGPSSEINRLQGGARLWHQESDRFPQDNLWDLKAFRLVCKLVCVSIIWILTYLYGRCQIWRSFPRYLALAWGPCWFSPKLFVHS